MDKPSAGVAVRLTLDNDSGAIQTARIVLGCVGATPVRARKAEGLINGKQLTPQLAEEAGSIASQECSPTSDLRGSEQYKRAIVRTLVKRAAAKAYERATVRAALTGDRGDLVEALALNPLVETKDVAERLVAAML